MEVINFDCDDKVLYGEVQENLGISYYESGLIENLRLSLNWTCDKRQ